MSNCIDFVANIVTSLAVAKSLLKVSDIWSWDCPSVTDSGFRKYPVPY